MIDLPVVIEYAAPAECGAADAFKQLVTAQIARAANPDRPWRFAVTIRHEDDYVGTLTMEAGTRELRAATCDEVTAALSLVIAMAQPELPAPPNVEPPSPMPSPPIPARVMTRVRAPREPDHVESESGPKIDWRLGLRAQTWFDGSELSATGAMVTGSVEVPWGFPKMMLEIGAGGMLHREFNTLMGVGGSGSTTTTSQTWMFVDTHACPIDLPLGDTGLSILACGVVVVGTAGAGLAGWGGGGGRARWQSPWRFYLEGHFNGLYGTRIDGVPALMDLGGSLGIRL